MPFVSINPATGRRLGTYPIHSAAAVERLLARASAALAPWRELPLARRIRHVRTLGRALLAQRDALAAVLTAEMGKPAAQARAEIEKCALACAFYARRAAPMLAAVRPPGAPAHARVQFEPLGVVLGIMPWNFPFWQTLRAAIPALLAGNTFLFKPAPNTAGCAGALDRVVRRAGLPRGVFQVLRVEPAAIGSLLADRRVAAVTLTGSTSAGQAVAALAGAAMKPGVFELGGSDAYLVLEDADLEATAAICAQARLVNSGQSCIAAKRFLVVPAVRAEFEERIVALFAAQRVGDPRDPATTVGPLAREDLRAHLHDQVRRSIRRGARVLLGGAPLPGPGFFHAPTVLTNVRPGMPAYDEELFGPVAAIIRVRDEADAVRVANASRYGLGAAVFTRHRARGQRLAAQLEAGCVCVNDFVRSDPALPFGGVKASGYGRELGEWGLRSFVNVKTVLA